MHVSLSFVKQNKLESSFTAKKEMQQKEIEELKSELERKTEEHHKLSRYDLTFS